MAGTVPPRRSRIWAVITALAVMLTGFVAPSAQASETLGDIELTLNAPENVDLTDAQVDLYRIKSMADGVQASHEWGQQVDPEQLALSFNQVEAGEYYFEVTGTWLTPSYSGDVTDRSNLVPFRVEAGKATQQALQVVGLPSGSVSLMVTVDEGVNVEGATAEILRWNADIGAFESHKRVALAAGVQHVAFERVPEGEYIVKVSGDHFASVYNGDTGYEGDTSRLYVTADQIVDAGVLSISKVEGGTLEIPFTVAADVNKDSWAEVTLYTPTDDQEFRYYDSRYLDLRSSSVTFFGLPEGEYAAQFSGDMINTTYSGNTDSQYAADLLKVTADEKTTAETINISRKQFGIIEFVLEGVESVNLSGALAEVLQYNSNYAEWETVSSQELEWLEGYDGVYYLQNVPVGTNYVLKVSGRYINTLYGDGVLTPDEAPTFRIEDGTYSDGGRFYLTPKPTGNVVVQVNKLTELNWQDAEVSLLSKRPDGDGWTHIETFWVDTEFVGEQFRFDGVAVGEYIVKIKGEYLSTIYSGNVVNPEDAQTITVADQRTTRVPVINVDRKYLGSISVPVTVDPGVNPDGVEVILHRQEEDYFYSVDSKFLAESVNGIFTFDRVEFGNYIISVSGDEIDTHYSGNTTDFQKATIYSVVSESPVAAEAVHVKRPIAGKLVVPLDIHAGADLTDAFISVDRIRDGSEDDELDYGWVDGGSLYHGASSVTFYKLPPGKYRVEVKGLRIKTVYGGNVSSEDKATLYTVKDAETTTTEPLRLVQMVTTSVTVPVNIAAGVDRSQLRVVLIPAPWHGSSSGDERYTYARFGDSANSSTEVAFEDVPAGAYYVRIDGSYIATNYSGNVPSVNLASVVVVGEDSVALSSAINAVPAVPGSIEVPIYVAGDKAPGAAGVSLLEEVKEPTGTRFVGISGGELYFTDGVGKMVFDEIPAGRYIVEVMSQNYGSVFSGSVTSENLAEVITVGQGQQVTVNEIVLGAKQAITNVELPTISGVPAADQTLSASPGKWSTDVDLSYKWFANEKLIGTGPTFTLRQSEVGSKVSVEVTATKRGHTSAMARSESTDEIKKGVISTDNRYPKIQGETRVGKQLTAYVSGWTETDFIQTYKWFADGVEIPGATGRHLTLESSHVGKTIHAEITASEPGWISVTLRTGPTSKVLPEQIINHEPPFVIGNLWVGALLEFEVDSWSPSGLTYTYQWFADGVAIPGATNRALKLTSAQLGKRISVAVTASKEGAESLTVTSKLTREAVGAQPVVENTVDPAISGTARVGSKLTAKVGAWAQDNLTYTYKWYADGKAISGATSKTFTLTSAQLGKSIKAKVTAHKPDWASGSATTKSTAKVVAGTIKDTSKATISGTTRVGSTLTAKVGTWSTTGLKYSYKWYANGTTITGATSSTLKLSSSHRGKAITVKVTASKAGYTSASSTSAATAKIGYGIIGNSVKPTVTGSAKVGSKLTARVGTWSPSSLTYTYQWLANGKSIKGATKSTYTIPAGSVGKKFSVTVKAAKSGYTSKSVTSAQTKATIRSTATASGKLSTTSIKRSSSAKIAVTVKAPGVSKPTGTVYVKVGTKTVKATLKSTHAGKITVTLKGSSLSVGSKQKVTVSFTPDSATGKNVYKSAAKSAGTLTVKK